MNRELAPTWNGNDGKTFPNHRVLVRLAGALQVEIDDEMVAADRRYIVARSVAASTTTTVSRDVPHDGGDGKRSTNGARHPSTRSRSSPSRSVCQRM
jgi:hypothetical protein